MRRSAPACSRAGLITGSPFFTTAQTWTLQDAATVRRLAHTLKGASEWFGAKAAAGAAWRLERMGHDSNLVGADEVRRSLEQEIDRVKPILAACARGELP